MQKKGLTLFSRTQHFPTRFQYFSTRNLQTIQALNKTSNPKKGLFWSIFSTVVLLHQELDGRIVFLKFEGFFCDALVQIEKTNIKKLKNTKNKKRKNF